MGYKGKSDQEYQREYYLKNKKISKTISFKKYKYNIFNQS
jgi:hypothetical protein